MPSFFQSSGGVSLALLPQDLFPRLHKPSHNRDNEDGSPMWCMMQKRNAGADPLKKLTGDVEELVVRSQSLRSGQSAFERERHIMDEAEGSPRKAQDAVREVSEDVHRQLNAILVLMRALEGDEATTVTKSKRSAVTETVELLEQLIAADLPAQLLAQMSLLEFEARKDVMNVCCALLRPDMPERIGKQVVEYLRRHPKVFPVLVEGYANEETALHHGVVLRSCARHRELVEAFLASGLIHELLKYASRPSVEVSTDAFDTLREMLLEYPEVSAPWLQQNFRAFFGSYNALLQSGDYFAQRQAQKLLANMLLDKRFAGVMLEYVSNERNLQIHMILLKDRSKVIQLAAFQVFKIFVANPAKPAPVQKILYKNREKLVSLLESLQGAKPDDEKLGQELRGIAARLSALQPPPPSSATASPPGSPPPGCALITRTISTLSGGCSPSKVAL